MRGVKIGISGWRYAPWRGVFYPEGLKQDRELEFASRAMQTIEIHGSFYNLQRPSSYQKWYETTPRGFIFSVKAPRYVTHILRLRNAETAIANFFASGIFNLREKLGPILWQFPPSFKFDPDSFENFLKLLPSDTPAARELARHHDAHVEGRSQLDIDKNRRLRHAVEIRNKSFVCAEFVDLLRAYNVALVVADTAGKWPLYENVTADFMYLRLHGEEELYASGYTEDALRFWARRIVTWHRGEQVDDARLIETSKLERSGKSRKIFCYFDNDIKVHAPFDAISLRKYIDSSDKNS